MKMRLNHNKHIISCLSIILVVSFIHFNSLENQFHFDDYTSFVEQNNDLLYNFKFDKFLSYIIDSKRPIVILTFYINTLIGNEVKPFWFHIVNILIHGGSAIIIYQLIFFFLKEYRVLPCPSEAKDIKNNYVVLINPYLFSMITSLLWATSPIHVCSVTYIVQRMASMSGMFFFLTIRYYMLARADNYRRYYHLLLFSIVSILALGSKQNTIIIPIVILLYEIYFYKDIGFIKSHPIIFGTTIVIVFFPAFIYLNGVNEIYTSIKNLYTGGVITNRNFTQMERLLTESRVIIFYLSLILFPLATRLNLNHDFNISHSILTPSSTLICSLFLVVIFILSIKLRRRFQVLSFLVVFSLLTLIPESTIFNLELAYEHRLYIPSVGFIILLAILFLYLLKGRNNHIILLFAFLILIQSYHTIKRNKVWKTGISLWEDVSKKSPNNSRAYNNLGFEHWILGKSDIAYDNYKKAIAFAPDNPSYLFNLGSAYHTKGLFNKAYAMYKKSLELQDTNVQNTNLFVYNNLGLIYIEMGNIYKAKKVFEKIVSFKPDSEEFMLTLSSIYETLGEHDKAYKAYKAIVNNINPISVEALTKLAFIYFSKKMYLKTMGLLKQLEVVMPYSSDIISKLGTVYIQLGLAEDGLRYLKKAVDISPSDEAGYINLGIAYNILGNTDMALDTFKRLINIKPDSDIAHYNLGALYNKIGKNKESIREYVILRTLNSPYAKGLKDILDHNNKAN